MEFLEKMQGWQEEAERKRGELLQAIRSGKVRDPITGTIFTIAFLKTALISIAVSVGTSLLTRALTPRQKHSSGQIQGTLQVPQSDMGLPIIEGYGADPGSKAIAFEASHAYVLEDRVVPTVRNGYFYLVTTAGTSAATAPTFPLIVGASVTSGGAVFTNYGKTGGGFRLPMLIVWADRIIKHVTTSRGGGGGKMGPKAPDQETTEYSISLAIMPGRGPSTVKRIKANTDTIYRNYEETPAFYEAEGGGNTLAGGASVVSDVLASGGSAVEVPQNGSVQFNNVFSDGTPIRLEFYLKSTIANSVEMNFVGDPFNDTIGNTGGVYALGEMSNPFILPAGTSNSIKIKNLSATVFTIDRLAVRISGGVTGVPHVGIDADDNYTQGTIPTPNDLYERPSARFSGELDIDGEGVLTGSVQAGSYAGIAIYPGNTSQLPDPTMQGAVDALYGEDSTPAFHNRCLEVLSNFYLTKYGGAIPVIITLAEHQTLDTLEGIFSHWCSRVGVLTEDDYDFSALRRVFVRGFPVSPPYSPADVMEELGRIYNVYFSESDKIYGKLRNTEGVTAALTQKDIGWIDGEADDDGELQSLDFDLPTETEIARRYELTFISPDRDFEQDTQGYSRQITSSEKTEKIELALTMYADEARKVVQRETYEEEVESVKHPSLNLDWSYLWLQPGNTVTVTEDDGTTSRIFITDIKPNIGVIPVSGFAEETAVYSQPVNVTGEGVFEVPPVPIPGMTILGIYDGPLLRDEENTVNQGSGFYAWAVKRNGDGEFGGSALYFDRGLGFEFLERFTKEATFGVCATELTSTTDTEDFVADEVTVDLHNPEHILESATESDLEMGANACIVGEEICQILNAEREPDTETYPNRWYLEIGLRARRNTAFAIDTHAVGERFVLINDAIKFIPLNVHEIGVERDYKMVTNGQSLDDAAIVPFAFEGNGLKFPEVGIQGTLDTDGNWRFVVFGVLTGDPEGDRYKLSIEGSARPPFILRGGRSRPVSLSHTSSIPSDGVPLPGTKQHHGADIPGNSLTGVDAAHVLQLVTREHTVFSFTYSTTLTSASTPAFSNEAYVFISPGMIYGLEFKITAQTLAGVSTLSISDSFTSPLFEDTVGEASGTRYSIEFIDGKIKFYRNPTHFGSPFYVYDLPPDVAGYIFPSEITLSLGDELTFSDIEIQDEAAAVVYTAEMQIADFASLQDPISVEANQQRVIQGIVIDGMVTEATFP